MALAHPPVLLHVVVLPAAAARLAQPNRSIGTFTSASYFRWSALLSLLIFIAAAPITLAFTRRTTSVVQLRHLARRTSTLVVPHWAHVARSSPFSALPINVNNRWGQEVRGLSNPSPFLPSILVPTAPIMAPSSSTTRTSSLRAKRQASSGDAADADDTRSSDNGASEATVDASTTASRASPARAAVKNKRSASTSTSRASKAAAAEDDSPSPPADVTPSPTNKRGSPKSSPVKSRSPSSKTRSDGAGKSNKKKKKDDDASEEEEESEPVSPPRATGSKPGTPKHQVLTERDELPRLWNPDKSLLVRQGSYPMKIVSWNVCGLRALLNKSPDAIVRLVQQHDVDVLCLQETKIQNSHVSELGLDKLIPGYDAYYSCSRARKGYSGTAAFVRKRLGVTSASVVGVIPADAPPAEEEKAPASNGKKSRKKQKTLDGFFAGAGTKTQSSKAATANDDDVVAPPEVAEPEELPDDGLPPALRTQLFPESISLAMGVDKHDEEGRIIVLNFPSFTMCNLYVPNSGQALARLSYRVDEWDKDWLNYCQMAQKAKPIMWLGDLNVAHTNLEVWNDGAKHLPKQAGVTPEERASFQHQLDAGFVDAFRHLHPTAKGHYSYWSQRANNRPTNKGLRLDYFVCDPSFFEASAEAATATKGKAVVRDSYMLHDVEGSDHCPVVLELEVKM